MLESEQFELKLKGEKMLIKEHKNKGNSYFCAFCVGYSFPDYTRKMTVK